MYDLDKYLLKKRKLYLTGEVEEDITKQIIQAFHYLSLEKLPITLYISSEGGSTDCMLALCDEIETLQNEGVIVNTFCIGYAYSAAAVILASGSKGYRYARKSSSIMLHPCSYGLKGDYADNQEKLSDFLKEHVEEINKRMAKLCGMGGTKYKTFVKDISKGLWFSAQKALNYGIIDKII